MDVQTAADQLYFVTVRLLGTRETQDGPVQTAGTAFLYAVAARRSSTGEEGFAKLLVTNKHVLDGGVDGLRCALVAATPDGSGPDLGRQVGIDLTSIAEGWARHPDDEVDVAVLNFSDALTAMEAAEQAPFIKTIGSEHAAGPEVLAGLNSIEEVLFIGYPNALFDTSNMTPIARRATTATPVVLDYCGKPAFLIDGSVFPGSSGSPVVILDRGMWEDREGNVHVGRRFFLLGMVASVHVREIEGELEALPTALGVRIVDPLNLGIVFKALAIDDCVDLVFEASGLERRPVDRPEDPDDEEAEAL